MSSETNSNPGGTIFLVTNLLGCKSPSNKIIDSFLILTSLISSILGFTMFFIIDSVTGIGYIGMGIFSGSTVCILKRMRLRAAIAKSVNTLKEENDELKENNQILEKNNEELEKNVDDLQGVEDALRDDVSKLKKIIGLIGENAEDAISELKNILSKIDIENKKLEFLVKNQVILYLYENKRQIESFKPILLDLFKNQDWEEIKQKIKKNSILTFEN